MIEIGPNLMEAIKIVALVLLFISVLWMVLKD